MSNFQPTLTINEGIATGWVRIEIFGDEDYGRARISEARKVLGMMKSIHGVGQAQVDNRDNTGGGGFFAVKHRLRDGTLIQTMTNDGHDTVRIFAPTFSKSHKEEKFSERPDDIVPGDYLWVGVRAVGSRVWYSLDCHLIEPVATERRGIVGTAFSALGAWNGRRTNWEAIGNDDDGWTLSYDPAAFAQAQNINDLIAYQFQLYSTDSDFSPNMVEGDHQGLTRLDSGDDTLAMIAWSYNGLCHQYWLDPVIAGPNELVQRNGPYDPLMTDEENRGGKRDFGGMTGEGAPEVRFGWDATFWIDPWDYKVAGEFPSATMIDKRPLMQAWREQMRGGANGEGLVWIAPPEQQVQAGEYILVIHAYEAPPHLQSTRMGEEFFGPAGDALDPQDLNYRSAGCDFSQYMEMTRENPLEVEVEIRIGRQFSTMRSMLPEPVESITSTPMKIVNLTLSIASSDDRDSTTYPFGAYTYDDCSADGGPNMAGPSYAAVAINVKTKEVRQCEASEAARVFGTGAYQTYRAQQRRPVKIFIHTAFPVVDDADWEAYAGTALWTVLESLTSGVYGCGEISEFNEGACQAIFAGTSKSNIYMFNASTGALDNLGPATTTPADYAAYDPPLDSTNFHWYYDKAVAYQNDCERTYGIVVTSAGGFYEMSSNYNSDPNYTSPDCC